MLFIHFFTFFLFSSFVLKVLPKTGFFAIPSNLLQVEKFNFLWIKLGSNWKQGLQQSFETKQWQTRKKCNIRPKQKSSNIGIFDKKLKEKAAYLNSSVIPSGICETQKFSIEKSSFGFFSSFPQKASLAWIPHWRCWRTKCKESELNTPKVSENLVRFTSPLFTGKAPQSPENIFGMSTIIFKMNIWCCEEKWDEMRK